MIRFIPNILTLGNLACGVVAILYDNTSVGIQLIFLAAFFDLFDGAIARKLGIDGEFGVQLDSLADMVTFGLASMVIYFRLFNISVELILVAIIFCCCSALRLAKYNIKEKTTYFEGIPTPFAALGLLSVVYYLEHSDVNWSHQGTSGMLLTLGIPIFLSILMIVPLKMISLKSISTNKKLNIPIGIIAISIIGTYFLQPALMGIAGATTYLITSILSKNLMH